MKPFETKRWYSSCGLPWFCCLVILKIPHRWEFRGVRDRAAGRPPKGNIKACCKNHQLCWLESIIIITIVSTYRAFSMWYFHTLFQNYHARWIAFLPLRRNRPQRNQVEAQWQGPKSPRRPDYKGQICSTVYRPGALWDHLLWLPWSGQPVRQFSSLTGSKLSPVSVTCRVSGAGLSEWGRFFYLCCSPEAGPADKRCSSKPAHLISLPLRSFREYRGLDIRPGLSGVNTC